MKRTFVLGLAAGLLAFSVPTAAADDTWPCRQPGWEVGDVWGPGPDDVVPDVPLCDDAIVITPEDLEAMEPPRQATPVPVAPVVAELVLAEPDRWPTPLAPGLF